MTPEQEGALCHDCGGPAFTEQGPAGATYSAPCDCWRHRGPAPEQEAGEGVARGAADWREIPEGVYDGANRYWTDNEEVLTLWQARTGRTIDLRASGGLQARRETAPTEGEAARCDTCGSDDPAIMIERRPRNARIVLHSRSPHCPDPFHNPAPTEPRSISEEQLERDAKLVRERVLPEIEGSDEGWALDRLLAAYEQERERCDGFIERVREVARDCGYAVGIHGSEKRDLDLIAAPWTDTAVSAEELVETLCERVPLLLRTAEELGIPDYVNPERRPHGRLSWALSGCPDHLYVDLAVMARRHDPAPTEGEAARCGRCRCGALLPRDPCDYCGRQGNSRFEVPARETAPTEPRSISEEALGVQIGRVERLRDQLLVHVAMPRRLDGAALTALLQDYERLRGER